MRAEGLVLVFLGIPLIMAWAGRAWWTHLRFMKALELRAAAHARLVDRFGSDATFAEFLKTEGHRDLLDVPLADPNRAVPYLKMLTALQAGFLLFGVGSTFLWVRPSVVEVNGQQAFLFFGVLGIALGVGSLMSAVAAFVVARYWGTLVGDGHPLPTPQAHR